MVPKLGTVALAGVVTRVAVVELSGLSRHETPERAARRRIDDALDWPVARAGLDRRQRSVVSRSANSGCRRGTVMRTTCFTSTAGRRSRRGEARVSR